MPLPVYVIHWNAPEWCEETVRSLLGSSVPLEVTVVDNGSVRPPALPNGVKLVSLGENRGFAGGANYGVSQELERATSGKYFAVCSHDLRVEPDAIERALALADAHSYMGIVGLHGAGANTEFDDWISGTFMLIRTSCARHVGLFDERFHSYVEDIDYCHRAIRKGWRIGVAKDAHGSSRGTAAPSEETRPLIDANFTLLAAKEGQWLLVLRRLAGLGRRALIHRGHGWNRSFWLAVKKVASSFFRLRR